MWGCNYPEANGRDIYKRPADVGEEREVPPVTAHRQGGERLRLAREWWAKKICIHPVVNDVNPLRWNTAVLEKGPLRFAHQDDGRELSQARRKTQVFREGVIAIVERSANWCSCALGYHVQIPQVVIGPEDMNDSGEPGPKQSVRPPLHLARRWPIPSAKGATG